jgi:hypothetical protein
VPVGVGVWVWLGGTHIAACSDGFSPCGGGGLGTLLGPEETPVRVCSWCDHFWPVRSNADVVFVVAVVVGRGVVVC